MKLQQRIDLLVRLGHYMRSDSLQWTEVKQKAAAENPWFLPEFIDHACSNIGNHYLERTALDSWIKKYDLRDQPVIQKNVGIIMAGNLPLVGFHDFLCAFVSGHRQTIKLSSKDAVLLKHLVKYLYELAPITADLIVFAERLNGCDAYIATGSNNSARYFDYYFGRYPHMIRKNRTSAALLTGGETAGQLEALSDDVYLYCGLGCRNVTKLYVPVGYDFVPMLNAFKKYDYLSDFNKYRNNYDYKLAIFLLNNDYYMTNGSVLLIENKSLFSSVSVLHYEYYEDRAAVTNELTGNPDLQCLVGEGNIPFGAAQTPGLADFADGIDTLQFLQEL